MHALLGDLASQAPAFPINGDNIKVLSSPSEYFEALLEGITKARYRIVLASLYLGTDEMEQRLADAVGEAAAANPELQVTLLFDALRGTRPTGGKDGTPTSTADLICKSVLSKAGSWVKASLYHTPELSGFWKRFLPARYNETVGIMHLKAYVFDDTTLMSGANLSTSYFTDRQDRYMLLKDCPALASYLTGLVDTVSHFSYPLEPDGTLGPPPCGVDPITDPERFKQTAGNAVRDFVKTAADVSKEPLTPPGEHSVSPSKKSLRERLESDWTASGGLLLDRTAADTWVLPTVQMGPLGVRQDERATLSFFRRLPRHSLVHLASAYFNLAAPYEEALLEALHESLRVKIVTAAPTANGFYGSRGPSGLIPGAYSLMEQRLYERAGGDHQAGLEIFEYSREGWTFHAKGLWLSLAAEDGRASENGRALQNGSVSRTGHMSQNGSVLQHGSVSQNGSASQNGNVSPKGGSSSAPCLTTIGSPNFGFRSLDKDLECQLWLLTSHAELREQLRHERDRLFEQSAHVSQSTFEAGERKPTLLVKVAAALSKGHL
ncbi:Phosphatidylglycerolphosphate synthase [Klebsormidium nitens]|uniref:CDP-diacylglycerol--glycerol-3-phosphate 3-phosphatidyltransferase n=1 Tax=Klebsormidium nitens TaxID=105231 RepID=A0A1Y1IEL6_KLENI|nr:Phosphatidylglycerolphosphate synthase [Klebsormidium nitens]|eukprot:GAQ88412.1 Phosphatidylglycerolphosphate synthase [Klebsormidium nitens]